MRFLLGIGLIILGGVLMTVTGIQVFVALVFVGVFLFVTIYDTDVLMDYMYPSGDEGLMRIRRYAHILPFTVIVSMLTLGRGTLKFAYKEEYYRAKRIEGQEEPELTKITRKEYVAQRNELRQLYASGTLTKAFFQNAYGDGSAIGLRRKTGRLVAMWVLALLLLTALVEPGAIYLVLGYEVLLAWAILLWTPERKDAKIIQTAYDRAVKNG